MRIITLNIKKHSPHRIVGGPWRHFTARYPTTPSEAAPRHLQRKLEAGWQFLRPGQGGPGVTGCARGHPWKSLCGPRTITSLAMARGPSPQVVWSSLFYRRSGGSRGESSVLLALSHPPTRKSQCGQSAIIRREPLRVRTTARCGALGGGPVVGSPTIE